MNRVGIEYACIRLSSKHDIMISIITEFWEKYKFPFVKKHVLAHQDDLNRSLNIVEQLNCRMDSLAKDITHEEIRFDINTIFTPTTLLIGNISYDDSLVTFRIQKTLYGSTLHLNLVTWYSDKFGIDEGLLTEQVR